MRVSAGYLDSLSTRGGISRRGQERGAQRDRKRGRELTREGLSALCFLVANKSERGDP